MVDIPGLVQQHSLERWAVDLARVPAGSRALRVQQGRGHEVDRSNDPPVVEPGTQRQGDQPEAVRARQAHSTSNAAPLRARAGSRRDDFEPADNVARPRLHGPRAVLQQL